MENRQRQALERQRRLDRRVEISQSSSSSTQRNQQVSDSNQLSLNQRSELLSTSVSSSASEQDFESLSEEQLETE